MQPRVRANDRAENVSNEERMNCDAQVVESRTRTVKSSKPTLIRNMVRPTPIRG